jgi:hypothetical protein
MVVLASVVVAVIALIVVIVIVIVIIVLAASDTHDGEPRVLVDECLTVPLQYLKLIALQLGHVSSKVAAPCGARPDVTGA